MGFSQQHAREALIHSRNNFDAATEYLLTTPAPVLASSSSASGGATASSGGGGAASSSFGAGTSEVISLF